MACQPEPSGQRGLGLTAAYTHGMLPSALCRHMMPACHCACPACLGVRRGPGEPRENGGVRGWGCCAVVQCTFALPPPTLPLGWRVAQASCKARWAWRQTCEASGEMSLDFTTDFSFNLVLTAAGSAGCRFGGSFLWSQASRFQRGLAFSEAGNAHFSAGAGQEPHCTRVSMHPPS